MSRDPGIRQEAIDTGIQCDVIDVDRVQCHARGRALDHVKHRPIQTGNSACRGPVGHSDPELYCWRCSGEVSQTSGIRIGDTNNVDRTGTASLIYGEIDNVTAAAGGDVK